MTLLSFQVCIPTQKCGNKGKYHVKLFTYWWTPHQFFHAFKTSFPASVVIYRCLLLCGLSGMVIVSQPTPISGFIYLVLNLVLFCHLKSSISSAIDRSLNVNSRSWTWSRLGPGLCGLFWNCKGMSRKIIHKVCPIIISLKTRIGRAVCLHGTQHLRYSCPAPFGMVVRRNFIA